MEIKRKIKSHDTPCYAYVCSIRTSLSKTWKHVYLWGIRSKVKSRVYIVARTRNRIAHPRPNFVGPNPQIKLVPTTANERADGQISKGCGRFPYVYSGSVKCY